MSLTFEQFTKSLSKRTLRIKEGTLKSLLDESNKTPIIKKKIEWLTEHLKTSENHKRNVQPLTEHYHLKLARKYIQLAKSAAKRGKNFNLTLADVHALLSQKKCYFTGVAFNSEVASLKRTIDRLDCSKGYVKGNVVACTYLANTLKESLFEAPTRDFGINLDFYRKVLNTLENLGETV